MKYIIYIFSITAVLLSACNGSSQKQNEQVNADTEMHHANNNDHHGNGDAMHHHDTDMETVTEHHMDGSAMTVQESRATSMVLDSYLKIKNAMVADNDKDAAMAGKDLVNAFDNLDKSSVPSEKMAVMNTIIEDARVHADHISENRGNIEHQREHFKILSTDIKDLIAIAGSDRTLYQVFCPMYNNNEGGMWLSASDEIKNPFFGSKMMKCGEVQSVISTK